jgi:hypothetical protein
MKKPMKMPMKSSKKMPMDNPKEERAERKMPPKPKGKK